MAEALNLDHLDRYTGGEKSINDEVLQLFDTQITAMVGELSGLVASENRKRWREIAHTIKGAARGVGAFAMGDAAARAEPVDPWNAADAKAALARIEGEADSVRAFIRGYLAA
jgi:HPt (histidine-containing phosphotransfer) domain-containing protein